MAARSSTYVTRAEFRTFAKSVGARFDRTDEAIREMGVVLERVDSNVTALAEALTSTRDRLKTDIAASETRLGARIDALETAVRRNTADIRKNTEDLGQLAREVAELRSRFDRRDGTLEDHEARIIALEKRAGITRT